MEVFVEVAFDLSPVAVAEASKLPEDEAVVQGEELQSDDAVRGRPVSARSEIVWSPGHGWWPLVVIIARTVCPAALKLRLLITTAGRRLLPACSEKGKGTTTTSNRSQVTKSLFILL